MDRGGRDPIPKISASTSNLREDISADETFAEQIDLSVNKYEFCCYSHGLLAIWNTIG